MSVYLPDNRITAPELWYPGRKPTVPVKVNWNHPLVKGMRAALFTAPNANLLIDYVRKIAINVDEVKNGFVIFNGNRSYPIGLPELNGSEAMSITTRAYTTNINSNGNIVSSHDTTVSSDEYVSLRFDVSGVWSGGARVFKAAFVEQANAATESYAESWQVNRASNITSYWKKGDSQVGIFVDGISAFDSAQEQVVTRDKVTFKSSQLRLGLGPQFGLQGGIAFVIIHDRTLTPTEISSLHQNPYQFLEAA